MKCFLHTFDLFFLNMNFEFLNLFIYLLVNNQMLRNARNLEELVGIKVLQADGLLA